MKEPESISEQLAGAKLTIIALNERIAFLDDAAAGAHTTHLRNKENMAALEAEVARLRIENEAMREATATIKEAASPAVCRAMALFWTRLADNGGLGLVSNSGVPHEQG